MKNFNSWNEIGKSENIDYIADLILTGRKTEEFVPDEWLYSAYLDINQNLNILDFGCGIGRNSFGMAFYSDKWNVVGYDNTNMIQNTHKYFNIKYHNQTYPKNLSFDFNWDYLKTTKLDYIFCYLVLQHVYEKDLKEYVVDFKQMTNNLIVSGRRFNDDNQKNTWAILEKCGLKPYKCIGWNNGVFEEIPYVLDGELEEHFTCFYKF